MDENYTQTPSVFAVGESTSLKDGGEAWLPRRGSCHEVTEGVNLIQERKTKI